MFSCVRRFKKSSCAIKKALMDLNRHQSKWGLNDNDPHLFVTSQWPCRGVTFVVYRTIAAGYTVILFVCSWILIEYVPKHLIFFTYWSYYLLTACRILQAYNVWTYNLSGRTYGASLPVMSRLLKTQWVLYNISSCTGLCVSLVFWLLIYDGTGMTFMNINTHLINSIMILLDILISAMPMRIQHVYQVMIFSVAYNIFTFFYWLAGGTDHKNNNYVYRELDYDSGLIKPMLFMFGMVCVAIPLIFCLLMWLTKVRAHVYSVSYRKSGKRTSNIILDEVERGLLYANAII